MISQAISIKYCNAFVIIEAGTHDNHEAVMAFNANLMSLGFVMSEQLTTLIRTLSLTQISELYDIVIPCLKKSKGDHVKHKPMYKNFPQEVMDMSHMELFVNALSHYWSWGTWMPESEEIDRPFDFEFTKFTEIDLINISQFNDIFTRLVTSNDSISESDRNIVIWFLDNVDDLPIPTDIPFKENMCVVASYMLDRGQDISPFVKTSTDILRIAAHLSNGDISLATNTRFKSLRRPLRRTLVKLLEKVINIDDIQRHRGKWVKLFHSLHVGDYSKKVFNIAQDFRDNKTVPTFASQLESSLKGKNIDKAVELLLTRPGDFARRVDHLLRITDNRKDYIIDSFLSVADKVSTRVLIQFLGNLKTRSEDSNMKIVFPKGNVQRGIKVNTFTPKLPITMINRLSSGIETVLTDRFSEQDDLGTVWIDPDLKDCPMPTGQRSASDTLVSVGRGTKLPLLDDKEVIRLFVYWKGDDIDLSASLHDDKFNLIEQVSYTNLKSDAYQCAHSGDITYAPEGDSEFIDINMQQAVTHGARYVVMNVFVYSGPMFSEHEECFAGWMTRQKPNSNEIYSPTTVEQKIDIRSQSENCIPVVFDLVTRKAIWTDLTTPSLCQYGGNNIESNTANISETLESIVSMDNKLSLYDLFYMHTKARGNKLVNSKADADTVFSMYEGITPYMISEINSTFLM